MGQQLIWEARWGQGTHPSVYIAGTDHNVCCGVERQHINLIVAAPQMYYIIKDVRDFISSNESNVGHTLCQRIDEIMKQINP